MPHGIEKEEVQWCFMRILSKICFDHVSYGSFWGTKFMREEDLEDLTPVKGMPHSLNLVG